MAFIRTRAFAALSDLLGLPGSDSLGLVDVSIATPVLDLTRVVQAGLLTHWTFARFFQEAGANNRNFACDPFAPQAWSRVMRGAEEVVAQTPDAVIPDDHDALVVGFGVTASADIITGAWFGTSRADAAFSVNLTTSWWWADSSPDLGDGNDRPATNTTGPEFRTPLPWYLASRTRSLERPLCSLELGGAGDTITTLRLISAPVGVLQLP